MRVFAASLAIVTIVTSLCLAANGGTWSAIYVTAVKPALVLIESDTKDGPNYGTAFAVSRYAGRTYFLTNDHVVSDSRGVQAKTVHILIPGKHEQRLVGTVEASGSMFDDWPPDLAVVSAEVANVPLLALAATEPKEADPIAIAGFPAVQLRGVTAAGDMSDIRPSYHSGVVNALTAGDYYVQYDALTDHGNSGGPLFDPRTGRVYGVVDLSVRDEVVSNNFAISSIEAARFLAPLKFSPHFVAIGEGLGACSATVLSFSKHFGDVGRYRAAEAAAWAAGHPLHGAMAHAQLVLAKHYLSSDAKALRQKAGMQVADAAAQLVRDDEGDASSLRIRSDLTRFNKRAACGS